MGDTISHSTTFSRSVSGMILGATVGVGAVGVAALVTVGTAGLVAAALVAAAVGLGIGSLMPKQKNGSIITGSPDVFFNNMPASRVQLDAAQCSKHKGKQQIITGSNFFFINNMPAARVGDKIDCGAVIVEGSPDIIIGGDTISIEPSPEPDIYDLWREKRDAEIMENVRMEQKGGAVIPIDPRDGCPPGHTCIDPGKVAPNVNIQEKQFDLNPSSPKFSKVPSVIPPIKPGRSPFKFPYPPPVNKSKTGGQDQDNE